MLELRHLRTLAALRSAGSLVRAAGLLNLTQSALSHQIKLLEDRYGGPLFERKSVPIGFTPTGSRLLRLADLLLPEIEQAERDVAQLVQGEQGQLRVALACHACHDWLMPVLDAFRRRWPDVAIDLLSDGKPADLLAGQADLVIGAPCGPGFATFPLFRFETVAVLALKHPLAARRRLDPEDFSGETLLTHPGADEQIDLIRDVLRPAGIAFERRTAGLTAALLQLAASRRGIAVLPAWAAGMAGTDDTLVVRPIGEKGLWRELAITMPEALRHRAYVADFVKAVREQCAMTLAGVRLLS